jgi:hypothetical protein
MIAWSIGKLKLTLGIGALCTAAIMADLSHQEMPIWLVLVISMLPLIIFVFVRPDEMQPSIVRPLQGFASFWYLLTVATLTTLFLISVDRPRGWPVIFIGAAIGCIPCVVVLKNLFWPTSERSEFRPDENASDLKSDDTTELVLKNDLNLGIAAISKAANARLELEISKVRLIGLLGLTCVMVATSYFCTTLPQLTARIVGWAGVCFFSLGFVVVPKQLFKRGPQVVIDERGIEDRRAKLGLIEWIDVTSLTVGEIHAQKFLSIEVSNPQKYLERLSNAGRIAAQANRALGFSEITIGFSGLSHSADEVMRFIRDNFAVAAE